MLYKKCGRAFFLEKREEKCRFRQLIYQFILHIIVSFSDTLILAFLEKMLEVYFTQRFHKMPRKSIIWLIHQNLQFRRRSIQYSLNWYYQHENIKASDKMTFQKLAFKKWEGEGDDRCLMICVIYVHRALHAVNSALAIMHIKWNRSAE